MVVEDLSIKDLNRQSMHCDVIVYYHSGQERIIRPIVNLADANIA